MGKGETSDYPWFGQQHSLFGRDVFRFVFVDLGEHCLELLARHDVVRKELAELVQRERTIIFLGGEGRGKGGSQMKLLYHSSI